MTTGSAGGPVRCGVAVTVGAAGVVAGVPAGVAGAAVVGSAVGVADGAPVVADGVAGLPSAALSDCGPQAVRTAADSTAVTAAAATAAGDLLRTVVTFPRFRRFPPAAPWGIPRWHPL
jgi:hypothetical protein